MWLRERGLVARIAQPGIEPGERLGRHRWRIELSIAWLSGYRRLAKNPLNPTKTATHDDA